MSIDPIAVICALAALYFVLAREFEAYRRNKQLWCYLAEQDNKHQKREQTYITMLKRQQNMLASKDFTTYVSLNAQDEPQPQSKTYANDEDEARAYYAAHGIVDPEKQQELGRTINPTGF